MSGQEYNIALAIFFVSGKDVGSGCFRWSTDFWDLPFVDPLHVGWYVHIFAWYLGNQAWLGSHQWTLDLSTSWYMIADKLSEVPSNAILNMFDRPSLFMGTIVTLWSIAMLCHGFVRNFAELCGVRILLGLFE